MDLDPEIGLAVYQTAEGLGGLAQVSDSEIVVVSEDFDFPHNIARFQGGFIISDTDKNRVTVIDAEGATRFAVDTIMWENGVEQPLARLNWVSPVTRDEVERFLGMEVNQGNYVLTCCHRTTDYRAIWWSISSLGPDRLEAVWEMEANRGKVHATLLHEGTLYGAISQTGELLVVNNEREFVTQVGDIRNMEISHGRLWMAGLDSVQVYDELPQSPEDHPRTFCEGIGRVHSVRIWDERVWVVSNGMILVYDLEGNLQKKIGRLPPREGTSPLHDRLRAIGYLE
jgi:hypothetical protein